MHFHATANDFERLVTIKLDDKKKRAKIRQINPDIIFTPLTLRLIKYEIDGVPYYLGTTMIDERYPRESYKDLYHERWGIEELYKISKQLIAVEEFHAKSLRGVRQELYAHMAMITLNRVLTNHTDDTHRTNVPQSTNSKKRIATNFKNSMAAVARNIESLLLSQTEKLHESLCATLASLTRRYQALRPNRSFPRQSRTPIKKWHLRSKQKKAA